MKKSHIVALVVIGAAIATITLAFGGSTTYGTFGEATRNPDRTYHIVGEWARAEGLEYDPLKNPNYFAFSLLDDSGRIERVVLHNNKPTDFERTEKVVVIGKMAEGHFQASDILMKCPSKYNEEEVRIKAGTNSAL